MEVLRNEESQSGTDVKPVARFSYETGKSGAWKHVMPDLMLELKEAEIKAEAIPVHMYHKQTVPKHLKDKGETPTVMVNEGHINKTTILPLPTEEEWRQATSEDHDLGYIKKILSSLEEIPIDPKELRNKCYVKTFQQGRLDIENVLISYYDTLHTDRVRQLRPRVAPVKFRRVVMSASHVSTLSGKIHEQRTLFRILTRFWWPMFNKEVDKFIRAC